MRGWESSPSHHLSSTSDIVRMGKENSVKMGKEKSEREVCEGENEWERGKVRESFESAHTSS